MLGPAITDIDGADLTDNDNDFHKLGFSIGGLVNQKIGKHALAQMELAFIQKGSSQPVNLDSSGRYLFVPYTINLNYLDVSLLVKQGLGYSKKANYDKFGVEFGLTMGNLVGSSFKDSSNMLIKGLTSINKFDLELLAGVYYNFTPGFFLDVRYSNSIIHAIKHDAGFVNVYPYFTFQKGNNMVFQITLGFEFGNKKKE
jgi:hypothetical protein